MIGIGISPFLLRPSPGSSPVWTPLSIDPDLYFDARLVNEFEDGQYANALNFYEIQTIKNQVVGGNNGAAGSDIPIIARQSVFGYNGFNCRAGNFTVNNYAGIDYQYTDPFSVAFSSHIFDSGDNRDIFNKRADGTGQGGWYVRHTLSNKLLFGFSDVTNGDVVEVEMDTTVNDDLPHTLVIQNTNGTAAGIKFYLDSVEQPTTIVLNNFANLTDIKGGSLKIGTAYASSHDAPPICMSTVVIGSGIFSAFSDYSSFVTIQNRWIVHKDSSNPRITGSTLSASQAYPSSGMFWAATNKFYRYAGSTSTNIVCFSSDDGYTWVEEAIVITSTPATWDAAYVTSPMVTVVGGTIYIHALGNSGANLDYNYSSGYYSSTSPTSGFTQNATPVLTAADYNAVFNSNMTGVYLTDRVKHGSTYYWFGVAMDNCRSEIFIATSSTFLGTITPVERVVTYTEADYKRALAHSPQVIKTAWGWVMTFMTGLQAFVDYERNLRSAYSTNSAPTGFTVVNEDYLNPTYQSWDTVRVYANSMYKEFDDDSYQDLIQIDGNYIDYYSGHDLGSNAGQTGINEFTEIPDLTNGRAITAPTFEATALDSIPNCLTRIFSHEHCYYTTDKRVYSVLSSVNYKTATPIGADDERPTLVENELNSLPVIRFDGGNQLRYGKSLGNPASWTLSFLVKVTDLSAVNFIFGSIDSGGGNIQDVVSLRTDGTIRAIICDTAGSSNTVTDSAAGLITEDAWNVIQISYANGDDFMRIYLNGTELMTTKVLTDVTSTGTTVRSFSLGSSSYFGPNKLIGDIAYFSMYNAANSGANITAEYNYLASLYNL